MKSTTVLLFTMLFAAVFAAQTLVYDNSTTPRFN
jgi:hypothetical protein